MRPVTFSVAILALFCSLVWSVNSLAIKFTTDHIPPLGAAGIRFAIGLLVVLAWAMFTRTSLRPRRCEMWIVVFHGAILFVQISLLNWGTAHTLAARSSVLIAANVVFVAVLAPFVAGAAHLTPRRGVGFMVCTAGLLVVFGDQLGGWRPKVLAGDIAVLGSSFLLGFKIAHVKRSLATMEPCRLLFWQAVIAVPIFMAFSFWFEGLDAYAWRMPALIAVSYQGLFVTGFCFICWTYLLRHHDAASLSVFGFTSPVFGVVLSILMRSDEHVTLSLLLGSVLVGVGIMLATTRLGMSRADDS